MFTTRVHSDYKPGIWSDSGMNRTGGLPEALALAAAMADRAASKLRSSIEPSISIEAEPGVAADAALAGSPSTRGGVEAIRDSKRVAPAVHPPPPARCDRDRSR